MDESEVVLAGTTQPTNDPPSSEVKLTSNKRREKKNRGDRPIDSPDVTLSKLLSYVLRHGALKERLEIRSDGYIRLDELLKCPKLKKYTIDDIYRVVADNEKQRFTIIEEEQADGTTIKFIRANQGHSLKQVDRPDLEPINDPSQLPTAVHGTYVKAWNDIAQEGLKPMSRTHIHFAKGLLGEEGVISGMRASCEIFIYLDVEKCFQDNMNFFVSSNGVILSEGLPDSRLIPPQYFKTVVDKSGNKLYPPSAPGDGGTES